MTPVVRYLVRGGFLLSRKDHRRRERNPSSPPTTRTVDTDNTFYPCPDWLAVLLSVRATERYERPRPIGKCRTARSTVGCGTVVMRWWSSLFVRAQRFASWRLPGTAAASLRDSRLGLDVEVVGKHVGGVVGPLLACWLSEIASRDRFRKGFHCRHKKVRCGLKSARSPLGCRTCGDEFCCPASRRVDQLGLAGSCAVSVQEEVKVSSRLTECLGFDRFCLENQRVISVSLRRGVHRV